MTSVRVPVGLVVTLMVAVACTSAPSATTTTAPTASTSTTPTVVESQTYDLLALASHPNGAQLRIERIEFLPGSVVVTGAITNGSPFGLRIGGQTELEGADEAISGLQVPLATSDLAPTEELPLTLIFNPIAPSETITLSFNEGSGASATDPNTSRPSFELGPIALDQTTTRPSLPQPVVITRSVVEDNGIEMQAEGIVFADNRVGVWVRISNPLPVEARIAPTIAPSLVVDDLGNRYPLILPEGEGFMSIPAESARSGTLAFAGRIHPDAVTLNIGLNTAPSSVVDQGRIYPRLVMTDIPMEGEFSAVPLPDPLSPAATLDHPAGVRLEWLEGSFSATGTEAAVVITNNRSDEVAMAGSPTYLLDDLGNRYPLVPLADNPQVIVPAASTVTASLFFSGRIADDASAVVLVVNDGLSTTDPDSRQPAFQSGPHPVVRSGPAPEPPTPRVFAVGARSRLVPDELAVSEIDQITQTLAQFDATEVDGGFQLTLPDSILFDFGSAELRPDALTALALIAEVLEYFAGAPVIVVGHTDSIGSETRNQALSLQRAEAVVSILAAEQGVDPARLTAEGRGATEPVAPNSNPDGSDNPEGRQLNRRVEVVVLTDQPLPGS